MTALEQLKAIADDYQLNPEFPDEVNEEVARLLENTGIDDPQLLDMTDFAFVTIDHETSMDLDQAAFVEKKGDDFVIHYALADAAYYVRPGTALFKEALRRGASYYFPGFMVPMLPRALSEGIVSLNPDVDRRAMVFSMTVEPSGACTDVSIREARIRSHAKLSFNGVQRYYDGGGDHGVETDAVRENLDHLKSVGVLQMKHAKDRNVVRYRRSEVSVDLDGNEGARFVINDSVRVLVERYNEQLSLLCNVEGAKFLRESGKREGVDPVYRVHPPPENERVENLKETIAGIAESHGFSGDPWVWDAGKQDLGAYLESLPEEGDAGRVARAIHQQALMINGRSSFRTEPGIHHGVGAPVYARFSAPMREIVGIFLHKETWEALSGKLGLPDDALREQIVEAANNAKKIQRQVTNQSNLLVLDQMFRDDVSKDEPVERSGTVMGMQRGKVYVLLDGPPIDVKVYIRHLKEELGERLEIDDRNLTVSGPGLKLRLGDPVSVSVREFDEKRKRWKLSLKQVAPIA